MVLGLAWSAVAREEGTKRVGSPSLPVPIKVMGPEARISKRSDCSSPDYLSDCLRMDAVKGRFYFHVQVWRMISKEK